MRLDKKFSVKLQKSPQKGGWTYVVWPDLYKGMSRTFFSLRRRRGLYKGMSRTFFSLRRRRGFGSRPPAPLTIEDARVVSCPGLFHLSSCIFVSSDDADQFRNENQAVRCMVCQPWVYLRLGA